MAGFYIHRVKTRTRGELCCLNKLFLQLFEVIIADRRVIIFSVRKQKWNRDSRFRLRHTVWLGIPSGMGQLGNFHRSTARSRPVNAFIEP